MTLRNSQSSTSRSPSRRRRLRDGTVTGRSRVGPVSASGAAACRGGPHAMGCSPSSQVPEVSRARAAAVRLAMETFCATSVQRAYRGFDDR